MIRAFQWDLARQTERLAWLLAQLPKYADWGYQELYLHLEDAVEYPSVPGVARADAYSYREMERLVVAAGKVGIGVVPIVNLLGHTQYLIKVPALRELNELTTPDGKPLERGQVCPVLPRTVEVARKLIGDMAPFCTAGKIHVGLDESYHLGKHPLSRREIGRVGLAGHFGRYVQKLEGVARERGLRLGLWADMLALFPAAIGFLPPGCIAYDWYYYPFRRRPAVELHNFREYDLAPALRRRGVEYWGCPMSGPFRWEPMPTFGDRLGNLRSWWERCRRVRADGYLVTSWEPSTVAAPVVQAVDAAAAGLWREPRAARSDGSMLEAGFRAAMGVGRAMAREMAKSALAADRYAYAGYYRWEAHEAVEEVAMRGEEAASRREAEFFAALARRSRHWPEAFAASLQYRLYLAQRDAWVASASEVEAETSVSSRVPQAESRGRAERRQRAIGAKAHPLESSRDRGDHTLHPPDWRAGRAAAQSMWSCTRGRARGAAPWGPNEAQVRRDQERWSRWKSSLHSFMDANGRMDAALAGSSPRRGRDTASTSRPLYFRCRAENFAPALQKLVVQWRPKGGEWADLRGRFLIEFQAMGAKRRAHGLVHPFVAKVPPHAHALRLAIRGVGEAQVHDLELLGAAPRKLLSTARLGRPAPRSGFPTLDWTANRGRTLMVVLPCPRGQGR